MFGPELLAASLSTPRGPFKYGNHWQYHSRSDHHSKVPCWGLLFDLLNECALLRKHAADGAVGFGINHEMRDFKTGRRKKLDLVICRPRSNGPRDRTFASYAMEIGVALTPEAHAALRVLPVLRELPVGVVHVAVEAKACMTEHGKARPRLYDELNSSHLTIHGASEQAIAAGLLLLNLADAFVSPDRNEFDLTTRPAVVSTHNQPRDAERVIHKMREMPRRNHPGEAGFDAFAITVVRCRNDGSSVELVTGPPAPQSGDIYHYEQMVHRLAHLYEQRFANV
jgi:hypothetical protein